jgi:uncharacterized protein
MRTLAIVGLLVFAAPARAALAPPATVTGIALDAPWKVKIYAFARRHFHHPAWGWQHSERDYRLAMQFARADRIAADPDVLFAAAMMHDMAAFPPWATPAIESGKVEHGDAATTDCVPILREAGFPMTKIAAVQAAERGHMFYSKATLPEAIVLHDADSVDFLGDIGIARMLALVGEHKASMTPTLQTLHGFVKAIPPALLTHAARVEAAPRIREMNAFFARVKAESAVQ